MMSSLLWFVYSVGGQRSGFPARCHQCVSECVSAGVCSH